MLRAWGWYKIAGEADGRRPVPWRREWRKFYWAQVKDGEVIRITPSENNQFEAPEPNSYHSYSDPSYIREASKAWNTSDLTELITGPIIWPRVIYCRNRISEAFANLKAKANAWLDDDDFTRLKRWTKTLISLQSTEQRRPKPAPVERTVSVRSGQLPNFNAPNKPIWYTNKAGKVFLIEPDKKDNHGRALAWFVLLGGPKLADRSFKTISEAMQAAESS